MTTNEFWLSLIDIGAIPKTKKDKNNLEIIVLSFCKYFIFVKKFNKIDVYVYAGKDYKDDTIMAYLPARFLNSFNQSELDVLLKMCLNRLQGEIK